MDLARWGLGKNEFPKTVMASGGRFGYSDDGQTPNTLSSSPSSSTTASSSSRSAA